MVIFDSAVILSSEQIERTFLVDSNDLLKTETVGPSSQIRDSGQLLSTYQSRSSCPELSKNPIPTQELPKSILLLVSNQIAKSEELKLSTRIESSARLLSTEAILSLTFAASDHQIHTPKFRESILCDLSESRKLTATIRFDNAVVDDGSVKLTASRALASLTVNQTFGFANSHKFFRDRSESIGTLSDTVKPFLFPFFFLS
jgi:hypothetical protein